VQVGATAYAEEKHVSLSKEIDLVSCPALQCGACSTSLTGKGALGRLTSGPLSCKRFEYLNVASKGEEKW